ERKSASLAGSATATPGRAADHTGPAKTLTRPASFSACWRSITAERWTEPTASGRLGSVRPLNSKPTACGRFLNDAGVSELQPAVLCRLLRLGHRSAAK